ncbi:MAG TPA: hypothetical protein VFA15_02380, partial [Nitrososphaera sp.]|nr:hypothetical protein [Nitrososphaera sp.]
MSGLGAGIGIGLTILDRLLQAREAQKNEDVYRQLAEQHNLAAGTPSASQYQWSEGQDVHAPQAYSAPTLGTPTPAHSSFLDALINPRGVVERAGLFNALAEENQKQREAVAAKQREYLLGVQKMLLDKATPQALNPVEEEAKRA